MYTAVASLRVAFCSRVSGVDRGFSLLLDFLDGKRALRLDMVEVLRMEEASAPALLFSFIEGAISVCLRDDML